MRSEWSFFLHLFFAFLLAGAVLTQTVLGIIAGRRTNPAEIALLTRVAQRVDLLLVWPSLVLLVGAGAALAGEEDVYDQAWVQAGMFLTGLAVVVLGGAASLFDRRTLRQAEALLARGTVASNELQRGGLAGLLRPVSLALLVVIFWLMTVKP